jgi:hypothetical protein
VTAGSDRLIRHNRVHCVPRDIQEAPAVAEICQRTVAGLVQLCARWPGRPGWKGGRRPGRSERGRDCRHRGRPRTAPSARRAALTREVAGGRRNLAGGLRALITPA